MAAPFINRFINLSVVLIAGAAIQQGLGPSLYVCIKDTNAISGALTSVSGPDAVDDLEDGEFISAQAAVDLRAQFQQTAPPDVVWVATYDTGASGTPSTALTAVAAVRTFGTISQESRLDADNALVGTWLAASPMRRWTKVAHLQTASADAVTIGKPSALSACEVESVRFYWHNVAAEPMAAAAAGLYSGLSFAASPRPLNGTRILGVALPTITDAQLAFATENDFGVLVERGLGASATERVVEGATMYSGDSGVFILSIIYAINRLLAETSAYVARKGNIPEPIFADLNTAAEIEAVLSAPLEAMANTVPSHWLPGVSGVAPNEIAVPRGYRVRVTPLGEVQNVAVLLRGRREVVQVNLGITGEEVVAS